MIEYLQLQGAYLLSKTLYIDAIKYHFIYILTSIMVGGVVVIATKSRTAVKVSVAAIGLYASFAFMNIIYYNRLTHTHEVRLEAAGNEIMDTAARRILLDDRLVLSLWTHHISVDVNEVELRRFTRALTDKMYVTMLETKK